MFSEAVGNGFYHSEGWNRDYPRIQILTVEDLLTGMTILRMTIDASYDSP